MSVPGGASTSWEYDARGRKTKATHTVPGLSGTRVFGWGYDSGDRVSAEYHGRNTFRRGEIIQVVYDVGDDPYVDLELQFAAKLARD